MVKKQDTQGLKEVFKEHGVQSPEMVEYSFRYFRYLIIRYAREFDEDLYQTCYARVVASIIGETDLETGEFKEPYYDAEKTNIATWIHSIVRNQASSYLYKKKKDMKHSEDGLEFVPDKDDEFADIDERDTKLIALSSLGIQITNKRQLCEEIVRFPNDHPALRILQWQLMSLR